MLLFVAKSCNIHTGVRGLRITANHSVQSRKRYPLGRSATPVAGLSTKMACYFGVLEKWKIGVLERAKTRIQPEICYYHYSITPPPHYSRSLRHEGKTSHAPSGGGSNPGSQGPAFLLSLGSDCGSAICSGRIWLFGQIWLSGQQGNYDEALYLIGFMTLSSLSTSWHHFR